LISNNKIISFRCKHFKIESNAKRIYAKSVRALERRSYFLNIDTQAIIIEDILRTLQLFNNFYLL